MRYNNIYFQTFFTNKDKFVGKIIPNNEWNKTPEKKIEKLECIVGNRKLTLKGFKQYNVRVENVALGTKGITKIFVMAREENRSLIVQFDMKKGQISKAWKPIGMEYGGQIVIGWKNGVYTTPYAKLDVFNNTN